MKVLIIAYDFPENPSIGGKRPYSWYRYLPGLEVETTVVTRHWDPIQDKTDLIKPSTIQEPSVTINDNQKLIQTPFQPNLRDRILLKHGLEKFNKIRKVLSLLIILRDFLFPKYSFAKRIYHAAKSELASEKYDYILATGEPFLLFGIASKLSTNYNIPWVADYRDVWTTGISKLNATGKLGLLVKTLHSKLESKWLKSVHFITTAAPSYKKELQSLFPNKDIHVIYNGFFQEEVEKVQDHISNFKQSDVINISYPGTIYDHQRHDLFMNGIGLLRQKYPAKKFHINFYGLNESELIKSYKVYQENQSYFTFHSKLPYEMLLKELSKSHILLLLTKENANWLNAKVFDYIPLNRKIMLVEDDKTILNQILHRVNNFHPCNSIEEVCEFINNTDPINGFFQNENISEYSRKIQSQRLVNLLKG